MADLQLIPHAEFFTHFPENAVWLIRLLDGPSSSSSFSLINSACFRCWWRADIGPYAAKIHRSVEELPWQSDVGDDIGSEEMGPWWDWDTIFWGKFDNFRFIRRIVKEIVWGWGQGGNWAWGEIFFRFSPSVQQNGPESGGRLLYLHRRAQCAHYALGQLHTGCHQPTDLELHEAIQQENGQNWMAIILLYPY